MSSKCACHPRLHLVSNSEGRDQLTTGALLPLRHGQRGRQQRGIDMQDGVRGVRPFCILPRAASERPLTTLVSPSGMVETPRLTAENRLVYQQRSAGGLVALLLLGVVTPARGSGSLAPGRADAPLCGRCCRKATWGISRAPPSARRIPRAGRSPRVPEGGSVFRQRKHFAKFAERA